MDSSRNYKIIKTQISDREMKQPGLSVEYATDANKEAATKMIKRNQISVPGLEVTLSPAQKRRQL